MTWKNIGRPGYFGNRRDDVINTLNKAYGSGNWRLAWKFNEQDLDFKTVCHLYEDAYLADSIKREDLWKQLITVAANVYDIEKTDVESEFDYEAQKDKATHLQDISIRRVVLRRGWKFQGKELVQIRSKSGWGAYLSPGRVPFHMPEYIIPGLETEPFIDKISGEPPIKIWWNKNSIEDFYQSNKYIQVREIDKNNLPARVAELTKMKKDFSEKQERYNREVRGIEKALSGETENAFRQIIPKINTKLKGKAPQIIGFDVTGNYVNLNLNCNYEELDEEGTLIEEVIQEELKNAGLDWIQAGFSACYYTK